MVSIYISLAVLSLLSVVQTAPLSSCESLIQPLAIQGPEQLLGKWMRVALSSNYENTELITKTFQDSYWMRLSADNESDAIDLMGVVKTFGVCLTQTAKMNLVNNTLQPIINETLKPGSPGPLLVSVSINLLKTGCSDCLLFLTRNHLVGHTIEILFLMSKRQTVTAAELEELKKQAECLNLPEPFSLDFERGICPDPQSPEADVIDMTQLLNADKSEQQNIAEKIFDGAGGFDNYVKMATDILLKKD
ncbi:uncharacterized protein LOC117815548 [Notolabrus celidotus]|uniref:uncharacterized protein LOC117815548 n=1 Tax=Notolabrus celidotus TaxID=1203425 RepID=UPI00148FE47D|nr:uncharacterized protein LOC117815548 [Notolabrus celidotus]